VAFSMDMAILVVAKLSDSSDTMLWPLLLGSYIRGERGGEVGLGKKREPGEYCLKKFGACLKVVTIPTMFNFKN